MKIYRREIFFNDQSLPAHPSPCRLLSLSLSNCRSLLLPSHLKTIKHQSVCVRVGETHRKPHRRENSRVHLNHTRSFDGPRACVAGITLIHTGSREFTIRSAERDSEVVDYRCLFVRIGSNILPEEATLGQFEGNTTVVLKENSSKFGSLLHMETAIESRKMSQLLNLTKTYMSMREVYMFVRTRIRYCTRSCAQRFRLARR